MDEGELARWTVRMEGDIGTIAKDIAEHRREFERAQGAHNTQMISLTSAIMSGQTQILTGIAGMTAAADAVHEAALSIKGERSTKEWDDALAKVKDTAGRKRNGDPSPFWQKVILLLVGGIIAVLGGVKIAEVFGPTLVAAIAKMFGMP